MSKSNDDTAPTEEEMTFEERMNWLRERVSCDCFVACEIIRMLFVF